MRPPLWFGLETEFGIARGDGADVDVVAESIALVRTASELGVGMRWDYSLENPHRDMRGFEVGSLRQDTDEAHYADADARRELTFTEIKSDLVLSNGARFYNDHAHPEYCTPECASVADLVLQDRAGEALVMSCAARLSEARGEEVRIYKNNTDFAGHSYGCHENYLVARQLDWDALARAIQAFLVTRQIFAGAGKFGIEEEDRWLGPAFQLSQRSDFFTELQGVDTMQRRPLINTRDEPHADPRKWRRLHVILGDANLSPFATWLKVGTLALVLRALHAAPAAPWPRLEDPLKDVRAISRDPAWRWEVRRQDARPSTAVEIQREYLRLVEAQAPPANAEEAALVAAWREILADLETNPRRCRDRLDWVAKHELIRSFQNAEGLSDDDPWLRSLDLEYHRLDPAAGLYFGLEQAGAFRGVPDTEAVRRASSEPPTDTRAGIRGLCVSRFGSAVHSAQWDHVTLATRQGPLRLDLSDLFDPDRIADLSGRLLAATSPDDLRFGGPPQD